MSDRDELAQLLNDSDPEHGVPVPDDDDEPYAFWYDQAEAILAAGWRKKPSREELTALFVGDQAFHYLAPRIADAVLALLDGPTETGEK